MADVTLAAQAVEDAPLAYPIPGAAELLLKLLTADYDGTGAGGDYVPCVQITLADGTVAGTFPLGQTVAAGSSVDVSWFPNGGIKGAGIRYDYDNQGGYLDVTANGPDDPSGWAIHFINTDDGGFFIEQTGTDSEFEVAAGTSGIQLSDTGNGDVVNIGSNQGIKGSDTSGNGIDFTSTTSATFTAPAVQIGQGGGQIGFFGKTAVSQPAHPVTLGDVIAALTALGLTA